VGGEPLVCRREATGGGGLLVYDWEADYESHHKGVFGKLHQAQDFLPKSSSLNLYSLLHNSKKRLTGLPLSYDIIII